MVEELLHNFHFLRPWLLLLLLLPFLFLLHFFRSMQNASSWENVCDKKLLNYLLIKGSSSTRKLFGCLFLTALNFAIFAAAGPTWEKRPIPTLVPENPVMILLNLSSDMNVSDLQPNRLNRAKFKITDLLNSLTSAQSGLIVYSQEPFLITPISDDTDLIKNLLPAVNFDIMPTNGDRLDRAIELAMEKLKNGGYHEGNIIVFSADVGERFDKALETAKNAAAQKYKVSVIQTSAEMNEKLKLIARYGQGYYHLLANNDQDIAGLDKFINQNISDLKQSENEQSTWLDMGYYLCFVPLVCCLFFFRRGIFVLVPALFFATSAHAGWFLNNNQEGLKAFNQGDFQTAADKFEAPDWKGAAEYRLGNYEKAAKIYAGKQDETALYNLGNALAKGGKIEEAIKKYEEVLKLNPNHEDAKFNLEYLKKQQEQQQQNQQNQDKQQQQQNQEQENQQQGDPSQADDNQSDNNAGENPNPQNQRGDNNQSSEPQQNNEGNEDKSSAQNQDSQGNSEKNQEKQQDLASQDEVSSEQQEDENKQDEQTGGSVNKQGDDQEKYDEMRQAKVQQLRQIPENPGGLLKAFIAKEYRLNRYGDD